MLAHEGKHEAAPVVAALIIVPQLMVALLAPWVGERAEKRYMLAALFAFLGLLGLISMIFRD
jgi:hypothetical protein